MARELQDAEGAAIIGLRVILGLKAAYPRSFPVGVDFALGITDLRAKDPESYQRIMSGWGVRLAASVFRELLVQGLVAGMMDGENLLEASIYPSMNELLNETDSAGRSKAERINAALVRDRDYRSRHEDKYIDLAREIGFEP